MSRPDNNDSAGVGKIERLPWELREQVCRKMRDGVYAATICQWLNELPEVQKILDDHFGEQPINAQNLSNFRANGYAKWLARLETIDETRELAALSVQIAKASGGNISDGAAQILSGEILSIIEELKSARRTFKPTGDAERDKAQLASIAESFDAFASAVTKLRKADQNAKTLEQNERRLAQTDETIALEQKKFQRTTAEMFLKWRGDRRATEIADGPGTDEQKTEALGQHIFGDLWK